MIGTIANQGEAESIVTKPIWWAVNVLTKINQHTLIIHTFFTIAALFGIGRNILTWHIIIKLNVVSFAGATFGIVYQFVLIFCHSAFELPEEVVDLVEGRTFVGRESLHRAVVSEQQRVYFRAEVRELFEAYTVLAVLVLWAANR